MYSSKKTTVKLSRKIDLGGGGGGGGVAWKNTSED